MRYAWIKAQEGTFSVKALCRVLQVRRSGYYAWKQAKPGEQRTEAKRLDDAIQRIFTAHKG